MANFNPRAVAVGATIPLNLTVTKVTERDGFRSFHLSVGNADLPPGFEAKDIVIRAPASTQEMTLAEANASAE